MTLRGTPIPTETPIGLTPAYGESPSRPAQMRAFARRAALPVPSGSPGDEFALLGAFLVPILGDLHFTELREGAGPPGEPWRRVPPQTDIQTD